MNAIEVYNLGKKYKISAGSEPPTLMSSITGMFRRQKRRNFWALQDVTFNVPTGQTLGVIGPNGSGKSSLLGLLARTITPTTGNVKLTGRVASLLELGAGFHSELTGRENIFLNGAILGIPRETIKKRLDHIIAFSGLAEFMDMPVKHYSSGMYVKLGFAVAVELDPDILLIDEVLAVGDVAFQLKCLDRIRDFQRKNKTMLIVSHALQTVEDFCDRVLLINNGQVVEDGNPQDTIFSYLRKYMGEGGDIFTQEFGTRDIEITDVTFCDEHGKETGTFVSGKNMDIIVQYNAKKKIDKPVFGFSLKTGNGSFVFGSNTQIAKFNIESVEGHGSIKLNIHPLTLMQGNFFLSLSIHSWDHSVQYHRREDWYPFVVKNSSEELGIYKINSKWSNP
ncbi:MAG: ABC transporter ATP-binding protein [Lentisphaerae bacterium]|nr:ABC transporter ATP-binding protein [Lentisphaerota bacterium]